MAVATAAPRRLAAEGLPYFYDSPHLFWNYLEPRLQRLFERHADCFLQRWSQRAQTRESASEMQCICITYIYTYVYIYMCVFASITQKPSQGHASRKKNKKDGAFAAGTCQSTGRKKASLQDSLLVFVSIVEMLGELITLTSEANAWSDWSLLSNIRAAWSSPGSMERRGESHRDPGPRGT